mmetsp:Transcript_29636/g.39553  ORF Transcript_29636/g.39553 Transcript_29636/m.39553 type:complete len:91 (-) Transcript_29636:1729-2001(-)
MHPTLPQPQQNPISAIYHIALHHTYEHNNNNRRVVNDNVGTTKYTAATNSGRFHIITRSNPTHILQSHCNSRLLLSDRQRSSSSSSSIVI